MTKLTRCSPERELHDKEARIRELEWALDQMTGAVTELLDPEQPNPMRSDLRGLVWLANEALEASPPDSEPAEGAGDYAYSRDADRLAQIERQVIYRTADMPKWADKWVKNEHGAWFCGLTRSGHAYGAPAPDYRPDEPGPLWLPIIDLGESNE